MKPFRGKQMGLRSQPRNSGSRVVAGVSFGSVGPSSLLAAAGWRTFPGERHHWLSGGHKPDAKVDRSITAFFEDDLDKKHRRDTATNSRHRCRAANYGVHGNYNNDKNHMIGYSYIY